MLWVTHLKFPSGLDSHKLVPKILTNWSEAHTCTHFTQPTKKTKQRERLSQIKSTGQIQKSKPTLIQAEDRRKMIFQEDYFPGMTEKQRKQLELLRKEKEEYAQERKQHQQQQQQREHQLSIQRGDNAESESESTTRSLESSTTGNGNTLKSSPSIYRKKIKIGLVSSNLLRKLSQWAAQTKRNNQPDETIMTSSQKSQQRSQEKTRRQNILRSFYLMD